MQILIGKRSDRADQNERQDDERNRQSIQDELEVEVKRHLRIMDHNPVANFDWHVAVAADQHRSQHEHRAYKSRHHGDLRAARNELLAKRSADKRGESQNRQQQRRKNNDAKPDHLDESHARASCDVARVEVASRSGLPGMTLA